MNKFLGGRQGLMVVFGLLTVQIAGCIIEPEVEPDSDVLPDSGAVDAMWDAGGCSDDEDCDDGVLCNGLETCNVPTGECHEGVSEPDGVPCDTTGGSAGRCEHGECLSVRCGDGRLDPDEACDDGNDDDSDACLSTCEAARCGDGFIWDGREACDDGNDDDTDACLASCEAARCGDGFIWDGREECDSASVECMTSCGTVGYQECAECFVESDCVLPLELCNGVDDDCDEEIDEGCGCTEDWISDVMARPNTPLSAIWAAPDGSWFAVTQYGDREVLHRDRFGSQHMYDLGSVGHRGEGHGIWGTSSSDVFVVGGDGAIFHFDGHTWEAMESGTDVALNAVWGSSSDDVYAVGGTSESSLVLHYDGESWVEVDVPTDLHLRAVWGSSESDIFVTGGNMRIEDIGGEPEDFITDNVILHFDGSEWSVQWEESGNTSDGFDGSTPLLGIWGSSGDDVYVVGSITTLAMWTGMYRYHYSDILHYDGTSWRLMRTESSAPLQAIWGSGSDNIYTVGGYVGLLGEVEYSQAVLHFDGSEWTELEGFEDPDRAILGVTGWSSGDVLITAALEEIEGGYFILEGVFGMVYRYDGDSWTDAFETTLPQLIVDVWGSSHDHIYAISDGGGLYSFDGADWTRTALWMWDEYGEAIWGTSDSDIFTVGYNGILHYDGTEWARMDTPDRVRFDDIWGNSPDDVFAIGTRAEYSGIYHYDGDSWTEMELPVGLNMYGVWSSSANNVFAVGLGGHILHFDGTRWIEMLSPTDESLLAVWGSGPDDVFAVGNAATIVHFDGTVWEEIEIEIEGIEHPREVTLLGVSGSSSHDVIVVGEHRVGRDRYGVLLSFDGRSWTEPSTPTRAALYGAWSSRDGESVIVGSSTILRRCAEE